MQAEPSRELPGRRQDQRPRRSTSADAVNILGYLALKIRRGISTTDFNNISVNNRGEHVSLLNLTLIGRAG